MPENFEDAVLSSLNVLMTVQFKDLREDERNFLWDDWNNIKLDYTNALQTIKEDKKNTTEEKERLAYANAVASALQTSIPEVTRGVLSAVSAFNKGDNISGAAAIMDICASIAPLLGAAAGAASLGGPIGMAFGGIFSAISAILGFFAPQPPSLKDEIKKLLEEIEARGNIANEKGVRIACFVYGQNLRSASETIREIMEIAGIQAWRNGEFAGKIHRSLSKETVNDFEGKLVSFDKLIADTQGQLNVAIFEQWTVGGWLKMEVNQKKDLWPAVLAEWCQAYHELMSANLLISCLVSPVSLKKLDKLLEPDSELVLDSNQERNSKKKDELQKDVNHSLRANLEFLPKKFKAWNEAAFGVLNETADGVWARAFYALMAGGANYRYGYLYSNANFIGKRRSGDLVFGDWRVSEWTKKFSIVAPATVSSAEPKYELFVLDDKYPWVIHEHSVNPNTNEIVGGSNIGLETGNTETIIDFWAQPGEPTDSSVPDEVRFDRSDPKNVKPKDYTKVYLALQRQAGYQCISAYHVQHGKAKRINWEPHCGPNTKSIRSVFLDPDVIPADRDYAALSDAEAQPVATAQLARNREFYYVGCSATPNIWICTLSDGYWVAGPGGSYTGIEVDPHYLWVYGNNWLACAPHASVVKSAKGKGNAGWLRYDFDFKIARIRSISPCADGTLAVATEDDILTADYEVNPADPNSKVTIKGSWAKNRSAICYQIQRIPIPCWSLYESLKHDLRKAVAGIGS